MFNKPLFKERFTIYKNILKLFPKPKIKQPHFYKSVE